MLNLNNEAFFPTEAFKRSFNQYPPKRKCQTSEIGRPDSLGEFATEQIPMSQA